MGSREGRARAAVADATLRSRQVEQQSHRTCRALLALGERCGWTELEEACEVSHNLSHEIVRTILARMAEEAAADPDAHTFVRDAGHYDDLGWRERWQT